MIDDHEHCPNCKRLISRRHHPMPRCFRPRIPKHWPTWSRRRAAMEESGDGFCACCDRPIPLSEPGKRVSRYHCGRKECRAVWTRLSQLDSADQRNLKQQSFDDLEYRAAGT